MDKSITSLSGVGARRASYFEKLGITTVNGLVLLLPRRYEDVGNLVPIERLAAHRGEAVTIRASVCAPVTQHRITGGRTVTRVPVADGTGATVLTYFNNRFIKNSLQGETEYYFYGKVRTNGAPAPEQPQVFRALPENGRFLAVYPLSAGLSQSVIRKAVAAALADYHPDDPLPEEMRTSYGLCSFEDAIRKIHLPQSAQDIAIAQQRLIFDELFYFCLGVRLRKGWNKTETNVRLLQPIPQEFLRRHAFSPTGAQERALADIYRDLQSGYTMHRLLQGDVGSGKTLVAAQSAYCVIRAGAQAVLMAPTEVLANQHYRYLKETMEPLGVRVELLTSSVPAAEKNRIKREIRQGTVQMIVGTHAILQKDVEFHRPGLVITDEQHRFGVTQRASLAGKGAGVHVLIMSATPIPRTLALMLWGDLDLSVIDELPAGRQEIQTYLVDSSYRKRLQAFMQKQIAQGGQVYCVCPMIEEEEETALADAVTRQKELSRLFGEDKVGLLHGKMKAAEKETVMSAFVNGDCKILVSTTVIEVGINVPAATLMLIENAERFGLSQLHQLRGRVGRGGMQSYCVLMSDTGSAPALERMRFFAKTTDGFKIAQKDLALRGPGNFFGKEQHGLAQMQIADLDHGKDTLAQAADAAKRLLQTDPQLAGHGLIRSRVEHLFASYSRD